MLGPLLGVVIGYAYSIVKVRRRSGFDRLLDTTTATANRIHSVIVVPETVVLVPSSSGANGSSETAPIYYSGVPPISQ